VRSQAQDTTAIAVDLLPRHALAVGGKRTVYVRDEDAELWARAEAYARARRLPMSALIMTALEAYLSGDGTDRDRPF
jgi:hypothetical protein